MSPLIWYIARAKDSLRQLPELERLYCYTLLALWRSDHPGQEVYLRLVRPTAWQPLSSQLLCPPWTSSGTAKEHGHKQNRRYRRGAGDKHMSCKPGVAGSIPGFSQSVG